MKRRRLNIKALSRAAGSAASAKKARQAGWVQVALECEEDVRFCCQFLPLSWVNLIGEKRLKGDIESLRQIANSETQYARLSQICLRQNGRRTFMHQVRP